MEGANVRLDVTGMTRPLGPKRQPWSFRTVANTSLVHLNTGTHMDRSESNKRLRGGKKSKKKQLSLSIFTNKSAQKIARIFAVEARREKAVG